MCVVRLVDDPRLRRRIGLDAAGEVRRRWLWSHLVERLRRVDSEADRRRAPWAGGLVA